MYTNKKNKFNERFIEKEKELDDECIGCIAYQRSAKGSEFTLEKQVIKPLQINFFWDLWNRRSKVKTNVIRW